MSLLSARRVFIGEAVCGGLWNEIPELRAEGSAMLRALASDSASVGEVIAPLVPPSAFTLAEGVEAAPVDASAPWLDQWLRIARSADLAIVIAPETDGVLTDVVAAFRRAGIRCIAPDAAFFDAAADKRSTAEFLSAASIPVPETHRGDRFPQRYPAGLGEWRGQRWVIKPADGCGSAGIRVTETPHEVLAAFSAPEQWLVQPFLEGRPVSVAVLAGPGQRIALPVMGQSLDEGLGYRGGEGPLRAAWSLSAQELAVAAIDALPGAAEGFIGVDMVVPEGGDPVVIEINPRLTTSYIGLRTVCHTNLAQAMLQLADGMPVTLAVSERTVRFDPVEIVTDLR